MSKKGKNIVFYGIGLLIVVLFAIVFWQQFKPYDKLGDYNDWIIYETRNPSCEILNNSIEGNEVSVTYDYGCDKYIIKTDEGKFNFFDMIDDEELTTSQIEVILEIINSN